MTEMSLAILLVVAAGGEGSANKDTRSRTVDSDGTVAVGRPAPTFAGWTLEGQVLSLRQLLEEREGEPSPGAVVVSFFATWCEPCERGLPVLQRVVEGLKSRGVRAVLVDYGESADLSRAWVASRGLRTPVLADPYQVISKRFGVEKALPRLFIIDAKGTVRTIFVAEGFDFEEVLRRELGAVLGDEGNTAAKKIRGRP